MLTCVSDVTCDYNIYQLDVFLDDKIVYKYVNSDIFSFIEIDNVMNIASKSNNLLADLMSFYKIDESRKSEFINTLVLKISLLSMYNENYTDWINEISKSSKLSIGSINECIKHISSIAVNSFKNDFDVIVACSLIKNFKLWNIEDNFTYIIDKLIDFIVKSKNFDETILSMYVVMEFLQDCTFAGDDYIKSAISRMLNVLISMDIKHFSDINKVWVYMLLPYISLFVEFYNDMYLNESIDLDNSNLSILSEYKKICMSNTDDDYINLLSNKFNIPNYFLYFLSYYFDKSTNFRYFIQVSPFKSLIYLLKEPNLPGFIFADIKNRLLTDNFYDDFNLEPFDCHFSNMKKFVDLFDDYWDISRFLSKLNLKTFLSNDKSLAIMDPRCVEDLFSSEIRDLLHEYLYEFKDCEKEIVYYYNMYTKLGLKLERLFYCIDRLGNDLCYVLLKNNIYSIDSPKWVYFGKQYTYCLNMLLKDEAVSIEYVASKLVYLYDELMNEFKEVYFECKDYDVDRNNKKLHNTLLSIRKYVYSLDISKIDNPELFIKIFEIKSDLYPIYVDNNPTCDDDTVYINSNPIRFDMDDINKHFVFAYIYDVVTLLDNCDFIDKMNVSNSEKYHICKYIKSKCYKYIDSYKNKPKTEVKRLINSFLKDNVVTNKSKKDFKIYNIVKRIIDCLVVVDVLIASHRCSSISRKLTINQLYVLLDSRLNDFGFICAFKNISFESGYSQQLQNIYYMIYNKDSNYILSAIPSLSLKTIKDMLRSRIYYYYECLCKLNTTNFVSLVSCLFESSSNSYLTSCHRNECIEYLVDIIDYFNINDENILEKIIKSFRITPIKQLSDINSTISYFKSMIPLFEYDFVSKNKIWSISFDNALNNNLSSCVETMLSLNVDKANIYKVMTSKYPIKIFMDVMNLYADKGVNDLYIDRVLDAIFKSGLSEDDIKLFYKKCINNSPLLLNSSKYNENLISLLKFIYPHFTEEIDYLNGPVPTYYIYNIISLKQKRFIKNLKQLSFDDFHNVNFSKPVFKLINLNNLNLNEIREVFKISSSEYLPHMGRFDILANLKTKLEFKEIKLLFNEHISTGELEKYINQVYSKLEHLSVDKRVLELKHVLGVYKDLSNKLVNELDSGLLIDLMLDESLVIRKSKLNNVCKDIKYLSNKQLIFYYLSNGIDNLKCQINNSDDISFISSLVEEFDTFDLSDILGKYDTLESAKIGLFKSSPKVKLLVEILELNGLTYIKHLPSIREFYLDGNVDVFLAYYKSLFSKYDDCDAELVKMLIENFKTITKEELKGTLKDFKFSRTELKRLTDMFIPAKIEDNWKDNISMKYGKYTVYETYSYKDFMLMGSKPTRTCMNYVDGGYNICLLSNFEANRKMIAIKDESGNMKARASFKLLSIKSGLRTKLVLHIDKIYTTLNDAKLIEKAILELAYKKASILKVDLCIPARFYIEDTINQLFNDSKVVKKDVLFYLSKGVLSSHYYDSFGGKSSIYSHTDYYNSCSYVVSN